ncbi:MAG: DNA-3-methyladenine glycosylase [Bacteroidetes Order II. Incertae sedis bacterium]|nr:DNA-3-methyladenine glycosylase [Bacteroidetes Order II. bacterium]
MQHLSSLLPETAPKTVSQVLPAAFFDRHPLEVARSLIGKRVVLDSNTGTVLSGKIVETEAYRWDEAGCHAWKNALPDGQVRDKNLISAGLFDAPGTSYVYISYGLHRMLNVVCEPKGVGAGVLIRAVEPITGLHAMQVNRPGIRRLTDLTNGPGKLCRAFGIDIIHHRKSLQNGTLRLMEGTVNTEYTIGCSTRIGLAKGMGDELPWRFFEVQNPYVGKGKVVFF